jgi:hypothetical protein
VDGERARLGGSVLVAVDDAHLQAVTRQLGRHQQAGRPGPDDERVHGARTYTTALPGLREARPVMNRVSNLSASG